MSQSSKGRKYFQQIHPTFAVQLPQTNFTKLEFLDHSDPGKDTVVRKKAREWVNKNRALSKQKGSNSQSPTNASRQLCMTAKGDKQVQRADDDGIENLPTPYGNLFQPISLTSFDPFGLLPKLSRKYDHLFEFFFRSCPEQVPGSDDKYSDKSKHTLVSFSSDNTVLGNMVKSRLTFVIWLYATVTMRDGMTGCTDTKEVQWFYHEALRELQETLKEAEIAGEYSEDIIKSISCIMATASFAGMFKTAELHRDAIVRLLIIRGDGDILAGLQSLTPWTVKALQWCEILVSTQLIETPWIPYYVPARTVLSPRKVLCEAARLTKNSLGNLFPLSESIKTIIGLLHHVGIAHVQKDPELKIDLYVIQPLYDAEYLILQVLEAQKNSNHGYSSVEILLVEALQLYLWTGPRTLPAPTKLCDLLVARLIRALLPLLLENVADVDSKDVQETSASVLDHSLEGVPRAFHYPQPTNNIITWSLILGTMATMVSSRENIWFKGHLRNQMQLLGLDKDERAFVDLLELFPATEGFPWINLRTMYRQYAP